MSLIKKRDVKEYFAARRRARSHPFIAPDKPEAEAPSKPEASAVPTPNPAVISAESAEFARDFMGEHSSFRKSPKRSTDEGFGAF